MVKVKNKTTKKIRAVLIVAFLLATLLTTMPFMRSDRIAETGDRVYFSALKMVSFIGDAPTGTANPRVLGFGFLAFLVLPVLAAGFQLFDFYYNIKNVVSFICSALAIILIIYFVGPVYLGSGAVLSLVLYLFTAFMSVMGIFARYLKQPNLAE